MPFSSYDQTNHPITYLHEGGRRDHEGFGGSGVLFIVLFLLILFAVFSGGFLGRGREERFGGGAEAVAYAGGGGFNRLFEGLVLANQANQLSTQGQRDILETQAQIKDVTLANEQGIQAIISNQKELASAVTERALTTAQATIERLETEKFIQFENGKVMTAIGGLRCDVDRQARETDCLIQRNQDQTNCELAAIMREIPRVEPRFIPTQRLCEPCCDDRRDDRRRF
jgi:hypothetical protein